MNVFSRSSLSVAGAVGLLALLGGCNHPAEPAKLPAAAGPAAVTTEKPRTDVPIRLSVSAPGRVTAFDETPIYARVPGYIDKYLVDMGAAVTAGQQLAVLAVPELDADLARKEEPVHQASAELRLARAAVVVAEKEEQRLKSQSDRLARAGSGVLNADAIEEAKFGYETARAQVDRARADVDVKTAGAAAAMKERDYANAMLGFATLTAPYAGVVTRRNVSPGAFVSPAGPGKGEPLFVVQRTDRVRVFVAVPEADADWVDDKADATFIVQGLGGREFAGTPTRWTIKPLKVKRTSWSLDEHERTLTAEIDVQNTDGVLRPGMYANATISRDRPGVRTLAASAVVTRADQTQGDKTVCFIVTDGKAVRTPIRVGVRDDRRVEVLEKQGADGKWQPFGGDEEVALDGAKLTDGQAVEVRAAK